MSSKTESSFGARLRKAQDLQAYIQNFVGYAPPRAQESVAGFGTLISNVIAANNTASGNKELYRLAVDQRHQTFHESNNSLSKLLVPIRGALDSQFGRTSMEVVSIAALIKTLRSKGTGKAASADVASDDSESAKKKVSKSELSYGSITQHFNDLVAAISQLSGYNPSNALIKKAGLLNLATQLNAQNDNVAQKIQILQTIRVSRLTLYDDLRDRVIRIKAYVRAQYGTGSNEYKLIRDINA